MIPKRGTGTNLIVPVCLSTSHAAFASTRIEAMLMGTGSAAGVAAKQLVDGTAATVQDVNVTQVQGILRERFQQIVHINEPVTAPEYYDVLGAGNDVWNGRYTLQKTSDSADVVYTSTNKDCPNHVPCSLYAFQGVWRLASRGKGVFYRAAGESGNVPPSIGWVSADGTGPAPTLVAASSVALVV